MRNIAAGQAGFFQKGLDRSRHDLRIAFVADPAFFPAVIVIFIAATKVIDEIQRHRMGAEEFRDHLVLAERERGGGITIS